MKLSEQTQQELIKAALPMLFNQQKEELPYYVGQKIFVCTVTKYFTGEVESITGKYVKLKDAAWIADTGRFADALTKAEFSEVEPYPNGLSFHVDNVIDFSEWEGPLPRKQK